jgi:GT2 family glycosyltransferase
MQMRSIEEVNGLEGRVRNLKDNVADRDEQLTQQQAELPAANGSRFMKFIELLGSARTQSQRGENGAPASPRHRGLGRLHSATYALGKALRALSCAPVKAHHRRLAVRLVRKSFQVLRQHGSRALLDAIRRYLAAIPRDACDGSTNYRLWVERYDTMTPQDEAAISDMIEHLAVRPLLSVIVAVPTAEEPTVDALLSTLESQLYPDWELCLATYGGAEPEAESCSLGGAADKPRFKLVPQIANGPAEALNAALACADGDYCIVLEPSDRLARHALFMAAYWLNAERQCDLAYSDHDWLDEQGARSLPSFKPDYSPDLLRCTNYIGAFPIIRSEFLREVGGWQADAQPAHIYDLLLRLAEYGPTVCHIPHVLCHVSIQDAAPHMACPDAQTVVAAESRALERHLMRIGLQDWSVAAQGNGTHRIVPGAETGLPKVSVVIPTRDNVRVLRTCITSLLERTDYPDLEILVVDNGSQDLATRDYLRQLGSSGIRVLEYDHPFNFSAINNFAVQQATGELLCLLNDDTETISSGWLREMAGYAMQQEIGAVGAKLLYPDGLVQHAGVILGFNGVAGHIFRGMTADAWTPFGTLDVVRNFSAVTAACLVLRKAVYGAMGGLDEEFAVGFNDVDLCLRIRSQGYRIVWTPHAVLRHFESSSRGPVSAPDLAVAFDGEVVAMRARWEAALQADPYYNPNLTLARLTAGLAFPPRGSYPWNRNGAAKHTALTDARVPGYDAAGTSPHLRWRALTQAGRARRIAKAK